MLEFKLRDRILKTDKNAFVAGIVNANNDSFWKKSRGGFSLAKRLIDEKADLLDIGAESSRPGSHYISEKDELNAFRAKIRELETNIYNANSPELIRHYEAQFIEGWQQCSDDFYRVLKESRITFFLSSFVSLVAIPFVGQLLSPHIGQELTSAIQAGAPLLNIRIGYFDYRNKISPAKADGGFSYIIKANRDGIIHI